MTDQPLPRRTPSGLLVLAGVVALGLLAWFGFSNSMGPVGSTDPAGSLTELSGPEGPSDTGASRDTRTDDPLASTAVGKVVDAGTGAALADARVALFREHEIKERGRVESRVTTLADGRFELRLSDEHAAKAASGSLVILVSCPGYAPVRREWEELVANPIVALSAGFPVDGTVFDPTGEPIDYGLVIVEQWYESLGYEQEAPIYGPVLIQADGTFALGVGVPPGEESSVQVWAFVPDYAPAIVSTEVEANATGLSLEIELQPSELLLGRVESTDGEPLEGIDLLWTGSWYEEPPLGFRRRAVTAADGSFSMVIADESSASLTARLFPQWIEQELNLDERENPLVIRLEPARWLSARFASPVSEPSLDLFDRGSREFVEVEGVFLAGDLDAQGGAGWVDIDGYLPKTIEWPPGVGQYDLGLLTLGHGEQVKVVVKDSEGQPLPGAEVFCWSSTQGRGAETNLDGICAVRGLRLGPLQVSVSHDGYVSKDRSVYLEDSEQVLEFTLTAASGVRGVVVGTDGRPLDNVEVRVAEPDADWLDYTGSDGVFDSGLAVGQELVLEFMHDSYAKTLVVLTPLAPGEKRDLGEVRLRSGAILEGTIRDPEGRPIGGAGVRAVSSLESDDSYKYEVAEADGSYRVGGLAAGVWSFRYASANGFRIFESSVSLAADERRTLDVVLPRATRHRGQVLHADGTPAPGAHVSYDVAAGSSGEGGYETTDSEGNFFLDDMRDEPALLASSKSGLSVMKSISGPDDLREPLVLPLGGEIEVRVELVGEVPVGLELSEVEVAITADQESHDEDGLVSFGPLVPGPLVVLASLETELCRGQAMVETELSAGSKLLLPIELAVEPTRKRITVVVLDSSSRSLPGAYLSFIGEEDLEVLAETTDAGRVSLLVPPDAELVVVRRGYELVRIADPFDQAHDGVLEVRLGPESTLTVQLGGVVGGAGLSVTLQPIVDSAEDIEDSSAFDWGVGVPETQPIERGENTWEFKSLAPGRYLLKVYREGLEILSQEYELGSGEHRIETVTVPAPLDVTARVFVGRRLETGGQLNVNLADSWADVVTLVDRASTGEFRLALPGAQAYSFSYRRGEIAFREVRFVDRAGSIELRRPEQHIRVRCLSDDGQPLPGAEVRLATFKGSSPRQQFIANDAGEFTFVCHHFGRYWWHCTYGEASFQGSVEVDGERTELDLVHLRTGELRLELSPGDGTLIVHLAAHLSDLYGAVGSISPGLPHIHLPRGSHTVWLVGERRFARHSVTIDPDSPVTLQPQWTPLASVAVTIENPLETLQVASLAGVETVLSPLGEGRSFLYHFSDGQFLRFRAVPGEYVFRVTEGDRVILERPVTVLADTENEVTIP